MHSCQEAPQARNDPIVDATPSERPAGQLLRPSDLNIRTPRQHTARQENEQQVAMVAIAISEEDTTSPTPHRQPTSSFSAPVARSNEVTPDTRPPFLNRVVEIIEEDEESIVDATPSERPASPSILATITKRLRAIRTLVDTRQADSQTVPMNTSTAQAQLDALDHLRDELRDEIKSRQVESDSTSSASLPAIPSATEANKRIDYEHPSGSESSDSSDSSSSEDSSSSDSWMSATRQV